MIQLKKSFYNLEESLVAGTKLEDAIGGELPHFLEKYPDLVWDRRLSQGRYEEAWDEYSQVMQRNFGDIYRSFDLGNWFK